MASSSSSSHSTPASFSQSWNHDVFLSFRGEDTRKTFVDHLYSALVQQGIDTYKDDETLSRGQSIAPSLFKAIQESRIAVIVFSKNYADSSWCLDELACIMKCIDERGQIVMPIFYHVDPSEVRKQEGEFGKAFAKQESENISKAESWRKALTDAANISGWEPKYIANGHEAKCIKEIVDTISLRLLSLMSSANTDLIGIETRMQDFKSLLEVGSGGVRMVGVWGLGGGGKSTLAFSIYKEICHEFDGCCFVENVREESSKDGLKKLQEQILSDVLRREQVVVRSIEEGKCNIKSRLGGRSVLIVLDDVDHLDQLEALAGSQDWFDKGSRIIITTRNEHLLNAHKVNGIYSVSLLNDEEAIELFSRHAFGACRPVEGYEKLSLNVVSKVSGLPLALKILGSFLCDKDMNEWMSTLGRLEDMPDNEIVEKLKISYDGLKPKEKELFLDIACFFRWQSIDEAMGILDACGFHPVIGVKVLTQKALITVSNGCFDMHDLVQEMARYIVRGEHPNNPEKHSRVWRHEDVQNICAMGAMTENDKIEVLMLRCGCNDIPHLPQVVANMKELRWIDWPCCPASSLPTNFQPTKLCCLTLEYGLQKQLWKGCKHLPSLKVLDLGWSHELIRTPDFYGLPCLERMILDYCGNLKKIHPSIGYHERLVFLTMRDCSKLKRFPPIIHMKKLEILVLSRCSRLRKFPEIQTNMDSLVELQLNGSGIKVVPSSVGQRCTNLVCLNLNYCGYLKSIEGNFRLLKRLKKLYLVGCKRLEKVAEDLFDVECCLEVLFLFPKSKPPSSEQSISFKNLINGIGLQFFHRDLVSMKFLHPLPCFLRSLSLRYCNLVDGDIPSDICELFNLQVLDLGENKFSRLHSSLSQLPRLKYLNLSNCKSLVELPDLPSSIAVLDASECDSLEIVGDFPTKYKWLWKVSLWRKNKVIGGERVLQSMLQGNAIEDHFMSLRLGDYCRPTGSPVFNCETFALQLPRNWYNDFSGFLICTNSLDYGWHTISIKQEMCMSSQSDLWEEFDKTPLFDSNTNLEVGYVSFGSLRHTSWWSSAYSKISFCVEHQHHGLCGRVFKVELVPRKSKGDPMERAKGAKVCSEFWDGENNIKTFKIEHDSKSSIEISWYHGWTGW